MDLLPRLGKRELICLLSFTCNYVVFVWRGFLFLWVLGMGYVILLWHSLGLPYNYFVILHTKNDTMCDVFFSSFTFKGQKFCILFVCVCLCVCCYVATCVVLQVQVQRKTPCVMLLSVHINTIYVVICITDQVTAKTHVEHVPDLSKHVDMLDELLHIEMDCLKSNVCRS